MKANSGSLAIGELLGAASFIVSVVVGSMCIVKPFKVEKGPFLRDVGFLMCAVSVLLAILWDGKIKGWEAGMLVTLYTFYVIIVVAGSWWERRMEKRRLKERLLRAEYAPDEPGDESTSSLLRPYRDEPTEPYLDEREWYLAFFYVRVLTICSGGSSTTSCSTSARHPTQVAFQP